MRAIVLLLSAIVMACGAGSALAAIELSTDHRPVAFGLVQLGEERTLAQLGSFHNEITCTSTDGRAWYLKISLLSPLSSGAETIPIERLGWQLVSSTGRGTVTRPNTFTPFSLIPDLVYVSNPDEAAGVPLTFRFAYSLAVPEEQVSGIYQTTIRFTLTELL